MTATVETAPLDVDVVQFEHLPEEVQEAARSFVINSWIRSSMDFRPASYIREKPQSLSCVERMDGAVYARKQRERILFRIGQGAVRVATWPGAPDIFVGWVCRRGEVLDYVYVKSTYRKSGVASKLTEGATTITHPPTYEFVRAWVARRGLTFDPFQR